MFEVTSAFVDYEHSLRSVGGSNITVVGDETNVGYDTVVRDNTNVGYDGVVTYDTVVGNGDVGDDEAINYDKCRR